MEIIEWNKTFSVDNEKIDSQHKNLIDMINTMIQYSQARVDSEIVSEVLTKMTKYASEHFKTEELYMEEIDYPNLKAHKEEHRLFRFKAGHFCLKTIDKDILVPQEILGFLSEWLIDHILHVDMKYKIDSKN